MPEMSTDRAYLTRMINLCIRKIPPPAKFFEIYLLPYFSEEGDGLDVRVGHFFYNLSSSIPCEMRTRIPVARAVAREELADLVLLNRGMSDERTISLADWREQSGAVRPTHLCFSLEVWRKMWKDAQGNSHVPLINLHTHQLAPYLDFKAPRDEGSRTRKLTDPPPSPEIDENEKTPKSPIPLHLVTSEDA